VEDFRQSGFGCIFTSTYLRSRQQFLIGPFMLALASIAAVFRCDGASTGARLLLAYVCDHQPSVVVGSMAAPTVFH
jgi:hypothetical protein